MADSIYQGDEGLEILMDCGRDITGAGSPAIVVRTPSGAVRRWEAVLHAVDGTARCLRYVTRPGDLAESGVYKLQASLSLGDWTGRGGTAQLTVRAPFA